MGIFNQRERRKERAAIRFIEEDTSVHEGKLYLAMDGTTVVILHYLRKDAIARITYTQKAMHRLGEQPPRELKEIMFTPSFFNQTFKAGSQSEYNEAVMKFLAANPGLVDFANQIPLPNNNHQFNNQKLMSVSENLIVSGDIFANNDASDDGHTDSPEDPAETEIRLTNIGNTHHV